MSAFSIAAAMLLFIGSAQAQALDPAPAATPEGCKPEDCAPAADAQSERSGESSTSNVVDPPPSAEPDTGFRHGEAPYGWHGLVGLHFSHSFGHAAGSGYNLGAEASVAFLGDSFAWLGGYLDTVYAFEARSTRLSIGPEVGFLFLGLDGGYLLEVSGAGPRHGATLRVLLTVGVISFFIRSSWLLGSTPDQFGEAGLLIKAPFEL